MKRLSLPPHAYHTGGGELRGQDDTLTAIFLLHLIGSLRGQYMSRREDKRFRHVFLSLRRCRRAA